MQYDAHSPKEYLELLEDDWRKEKLLTVRQLILSHAPNFLETIQYKMLSYGDSETGVFGLNAQKHYVSLYVGSIEKIENSDQLLVGLDYGKGCIRLKKRTDISKTGIEQFIIQAIEMWQEGKDTTC